MMVTTTVTTSQDIYSSSSSNSSNSNVLQQHYLLVDNNDKVSTINKTTKNMETIIISSSNDVNRLAVTFSNNRDLATLRVPSEEEEDNDVRNNRTVSYGYHPSSFVTNMHHTPRFHHTNRLGMLLSTNPTAPMDYAHGIKDFTIVYLITPFIIWACLLGILQCVYGVKRVGCAAGGSVLDMYILSKPPYALSRKQRKKRILRSWRIQSTFMIASIIVPVVSIIMMTLGWSTIESAILEIQSFVTDIETLTYRGWNAINGLEQTRINLLEESDNEFVNGIIDYYHYNQQQNEIMEEQQVLEQFPTATQHPSAEDTQASFYDIEGFLTNNNSTTSTDTNNETGYVAYSNGKNSIFVDEWCPNAEEHMGDLIFLVDAMAIVEDNTQSMIQYFEQFATTSLDDSYFELVTETTTYINATLEWFLQHDWILKLIIMMLNVVNFLLLMNVYCFSKNNVIHEPTRFYVAYILMPLFIALVIAVWVFTCAFGITAIVNADFCAGGESPGSPQGTMEDVILSIAQYGNLDRSTFDNTTTSMSAVTPTASNILEIVYHAIEYYSSGCLSEYNPLEFLNEVSNQLEIAVAHVNQLSLIVPMDNNEEVLTVLNEACGTDSMAFLPEALYDLKIQISHVQNYISQLAETASCHQISPLFQRISHGAICEESPYGLTVLWSCSFVLCILAFIMLTTRAALYNSVKPKKKRDKKPRRIVEKEFNEYKEYMGQYYEDTEQWNIEQPLPPESAKKPTKITLEFDEGLETVPTFETTPTSSDPSSDDSPIEVTARTNIDAVSDIAGIHREEQDDDSYGSSYDSEISDESDSDDEDTDSVMDEQSAIASFMSETKSIAMQTLISIQNLKPLLGNVGIGQKKNSKSERNEQDNDGVDDELLFVGADAIVADKSTLKNDDAASICEDSLGFTLPGMDDVPLTPSSCKDPRSKGRVGTRMDGDGLQKVVDRVSNHYDQDTPNKHPSSLYFDGPRRIMLDSLTPSSVISALTPLAPEKAFSFLGRTMTANYFPTKKKEEEEIDNLLYDELYRGDDMVDNDGVDENIAPPATTPKKQRQHIGALNDGMTGYSLSPAIPSVKPKQLEMSPLLSPRKPSSRKNYKFQNVADEKNTQLQQPGPKKGSKFVPGTSARRKMSYQHAASADVSESSSQSKDDAFPSIDSRRRVSTTNAQQGHVSNRVRELEDRTKGGNGRD